MKNKNTLAIICFIVAAILLLEFFGISLASILAGLLPFILVGAGVIGFLNGKKVIGTILLVIGGIWTLSILSKWFLIIIAVALIFFGVRAFTKKNHYRQY